MITTVLSDFSKVILFAKDKSYTGTLNGLYKELKQKGDFNFFDFFEFNEELLEFYKSLKDKYSLNIFTTGTIQNDPNVQEKIGPIFMNTITAADYGLDKKNSDSYKFIADKLNKNPDEIVYIDDSEGNIKAAATAGMQTIQYTDLNELKIRLGEILL